MDIFKFPHFMPTVPLSADVRIPNAAIATIHNKGILICR